MAAANDLAFGKGLFSRRGYQSHREEVQTKRSKSVHRSSTLICNGSKPRKRTVKAKAAPTAASQRSRRNQRVDLERRLSDPETIIRRANAAARAPRGPYTRVADEGRRGGRDGRDGHIDRSSTYRASAAPDEAQAADPPIVRTIDHHAPPRSRAARPSRWSSSETQSQLTLRMDGSTVGQQQGSESIQPESYGVQLSPTTRQGSPGPKSGAERSQPSSQDVKRSPTSSHGSAGQPSRAGHSRQVWADEPLRESSPTDTAAGAGQSGSDSVKKPALIAQPSQEQTAPDPATGQGETSCAARCEQVGEDGDGTEQKSPDGSDKSQNTGKRAREDEQADDDQGQSKRRRPDEPSPRDGDNVDTDDQQDQPQEQPSETPCARFERRMNELDDQYAATIAQDGWLDPIAGEGQADRTLYNDATWRAIMAVTEAISATDGHQFSVMDEMTLARGDALPVPAYVRIARPQHETLIPYTHNNHTSLFILRRTGAEEPGAVNGFELIHRDSSSGRRTHRVGRAGPANDYRRQLIATGWQGNGIHAQISTETPSDGSVTDQSAAWTCGLHTIFNAWAFALGLELSRRPRIERYDAFIDSGVRLVRYAVAGLPSSQDIKDFFDCYGFVREGEEIETDRHFTHTLPLPAWNSLINHAARVRIREELDANPVLPAEFPEGIEGLRAVLATIDILLGAETDVTTSTGEDILNAFIQCLGIQTDVATGGETAGRTDAAASTRDLPKSGDLQQADETSTLGWVRLVSAVPLGPEVSQSTQTSSVPADVLPSDALLPAQTGDIAAQIEQNVSDSRAETTPRARPETAPSGPTSMAALNAVIPPDVRPSTVEHTELSDQQDRKRAAVRPAGPASLTESTPATQPEEIPSDTTIVEALNSRILNDMRPGTVVHNEYRDPWERDRDESLQRALGHLSQAQTIQRVLAISTLGEQQTNSPSTAVHTAGATGVGPPIPNSESGHDRTITGDDGDDSDSDLFDPEASYDMAIQEDDDLNQQIQDELDHADDEPRTPPRTQTTTDIEFDAVADGLSPGTATERRRDVAKSTQTIDRTQSSAAASTAHVDTPEDDCDDTREVHDFDEEFYGS